MQAAGCETKKRYRLDKTKGNGVTRYELLENGRCVCAFDAADLPRVTALLMEAEGARQGLALRFQPVDPDGRQVFDCPACGVSNAVLEDDAGFQCRACYARFGEDAFDDWRDGLDPRDWPEVETPAAEDWQPYLERLYQREGNDWPLVAFERLLQLTARYGYIGTWSQDAQERAEQEERLALHRWAREVIAAGVAFQQKPW